MSTVKSSLMFLEFIKELPDSSIFKISADDSNNTETGQIVIFHHDNHSIEFPEPLFEGYEYLDSNRKWLRSILFTTLKVENKQNFKIPFAFPADRSKSIAPENALTVYSDGSCNENGTGGWAAIILLPDGRSIELTGSEENSTSNRMELMAASKGIEKAAELLSICNKNGINLLTDSMYVLKGITHRLEVWSINGFITAKGTPVTNVDIWEKIKKVLESIDVCCRWIQSNTTDEHHLRCDILAGEQSSSTNAAAQSMSANQA
jgi:ribonuclease HI